MNLLPRGTSDKECARFCELWRLVYCWDLEIHKYGHKRCYVPTLKLNLIQKELLQKLITGVHWLCSTQEEHFVCFQIDDKLSLEELEIAGVEHATRQQARHVYRIDVSMFLLICVSYHLWLWLSSTLIAVICLALPCSLIYRRKHNQSNYVISETIFVA